MDHQRFFFFARSAAFFSYSKHLFSCIEEVRTKQKQCGQPFRIAIYQVSGDLSTSSASFPSLDHEGLPDCPRRRITFAAFDKKGRPITVSPLNGMY